MLSPPPTLHCTALVVSSLPSVHSTLEQALDTYDVSLRHESNVFRAADAAKRDRIPIVLATSEIDWRKMLNSLEGGADSPSVILLMQGADANLWAEALKLGVFDALSLSADRDRMVWALEAAYRRWERRQLVQAALEQNPLLGS